MTLLRRWRWRPPLVSVPIAFWLLAGLGYVLGWKVAAFVVQGLSLAAWAVLALTRDRRDAWRARRSLPPPEREALKGYPTWW